MLQFTYFMDAEEKDFLLLQLLSDYSEPNRTELSTSLRWIAHPGWGVGTHRLDPVGITYRWRLLIVKIIRYNFGFVFIYRETDRATERSVSPRWEPAVYRFSTVSYPFRARRFLISAATKEDFPVERVHRRHRRCRHRRHDIQTQEEALLLHW